MCFLSGPTAGVLFGPHRPQRLTALSEQQNGWRQGLTFGCYSLLTSGASWFILVQHVAVSSGSGKSDLEKMSGILEAVPQVKFICLDVANGYSEHFVEFVKLVRAKFPEHTIMVGIVEHPLGGGKAERGLFSVLGELLTEMSCESLQKEEAEAMKVCGLALHKN